MAIHASKYKHFITALSSAASPESEYIILIIIYKYNISNEYLLLLNVVIFMMMSIVLWLCAMWYGCDVCNKSAGILVVLD
jgi:hypothetical protein